VRSNVHLKALHFQTGKEKRCKNIRSKIYCSTQYLYYNESSTLKSINTVRSNTTVAKALVIKKKDEQRIQAFEMKGLRQILRTSWTAKRLMNQYWRKQGTLSRCEEKKTKIFGHRLESQATV